LQYILARSQFTMKLYDVIMIAVVLLSPVIAVQVQKQIELLRERRGRKNWVFQTLMGTRAARLSADHVQALNMIDLVFYGSRTVLGLRRSKKEQRVLDAWKEYLDLLCTPFPAANPEPWIIQREELFVNLLFAISQDTGFVFDRVQLKKGAYSPQAHGEIEVEQTALRKSALEVFSGKRPIKVQVFQSGDGTNAQPIDSAQPITTNQRN
jgi:hypothetical protein